MKILVVTNMYPDNKRPFYGIFVKEQVDSLRKQGVDIDVYYICGKDNKIQYFSSVIDLWRMLRNQKYDIIHAHHTFCIYPVLVSSILARKKVPILLTFHEGEVHASYQKVQTGESTVKRLVFSKEIKRFALERCNLIISVQEELIENLKYVGNYLTLPCGVDTNLFRPLNKDDCRAKLNLPKDRIIIFFPADPQNKQKGVDILKSAIAELNENIHLCTGGGIRHEDMPLYMNAADIVVQLSMFEASPSVLKEALAVGVPAVFTDAGDSKLIIGDTEGYYLCNRTPSEVRMCIIKALKHNGRCHGNNRIDEIGLSLDQVATKIKRIYAAAADTMDKEKRIR